MEEVEKNEQPRQKRKNRKITARERGKWIGRGTWAVREGRKTNSPEGGER